LIIFNRHIAAKNKQSKILSKSVDCITTLAKISLWQRHLAAKNKVENTCAECTFTNLTSNNFFHPRRCPSPNKLRHSDSPLFIPHCASLISKTCSHPTHLCKLGPQKVWGKGKCTHNLNAHTCVVG